MSYPGLPVHLHAMGLRTTRHAGKYMQKRFTGKESSYNIIGSRVLSFSYVELFCAPCQAGDAPCNTSAAPRGVRTMGMSCTPWPSTGCSSGPPCLPACGACSAAWRACPASRRWAACGSQAPHTLRASGPPATAAPCEHADSQPVGDKLCRHQSTCSQPKHCIADTSIQLICSIWQVQACGDACRTLDTEVAPAAYCKGRWARHARLPVRAADERARPPRVPERWNLLAALGRAARQRDVDHSLQPVLAAAPVPALPHIVEGRLLPAAGLLAHPPRPDLPRGW